MHQQDPHHLHLLKRMCLRLARLTVQGQSDTIRVQTNNVRAFSVRVNTAVQSPSMIVDGQLLGLDASKLSDDLLHLTNDEGVWQVSCRQIRMRHL